MAMLRPVMLDQDRALMERLILELGDLYNMQIEWSDEKATWLTAACALAGGLVGGRLGIALGAGLGGYIGFSGVIDRTKKISLREVWSSCKEQLKELLYIVYDFLRRVDKHDIIRAYKFVMACRTSQKKLVSIIMEFITFTLGREIVSNMIPA